MRYRREWGIVEAVVAGVALGAAAAAAVAAQVRPRVLNSPTRVPPEPLAPGSRFPHEAFTPVLAAIVDEHGLVDYEALRHDPMGLYQYVAWVEAYSPANTPDFFPTAEDRFAYWLNAYNALVLLTILDAYPVASILQVRPLGRVFYALRFPVGGHPMSLEEIEHGIIRPTFKDPRSHFALAAATMGSAPLRPEAYLPDQLDAQLEDQARRFMSDPYKVRIDVPSKSLLVSPIFKWFSDDFTNWMRDHAPTQEPDIINYVLPYLTDLSHHLVVEDHYRLGSLPYDWRLNVSPRQAQAQAA